MEADLSSLALELAQWGNEGAKGLAWMDPPPTAMLEQARDLLQRLEALDEAGAITPLGREMASLPLHPRLAHMLLASRQRAALPLAAQLAALLSERDLLRQGGPQRDPDVRTRLEMLRGDAGAKQVERPVRQRMLDNAAQFARLAERSGSAPRRGAQEAARSTSPVTPGTLLAMAFPDRIGKRRAEGSGRYLLSNGRGAAFPAATGLSAQEYIVAVELDDRDREARIDLAAPLEASDLEALYGTRFVDDEKVEWDSRAGAVLAQRSRRFGALIVEQKPLQPVPQDRAVAAMLVGIRQLGIESLPWDEATRNLQARLEFARRLPNAPHAPWPASDDQSLLGELEEWLPRWLAGVTRREQLARVPLADALLGRLAGAQRRALEELAPRELAVPSGSHIRIDYAGDGAPAIAVRLQEVFGWRETPRIGGGTVPVALRLLSPAQRPVQITRDLAGFWKSSYVEVRKEMRGRYPKHNWPEDPLSAPPTRGARRRI
jgi:ATP-dependent helicase HrpB